ncbi:hypothetical protein EC968_000372 [Mortierella alpina]|nr:hypothetical protein EC968_000372 [Mortierella alpina]
MPSYYTLTLDLKCLVFDVANGSQAYALVKTQNIPVPFLIQAIIPAADPQSSTWKFVSAGWPLQGSYDVFRDTASCIMNKAGELIAIDTWKGVQNSDTRTFRGLVYNPYNPLPLVEGRQTSNALWMGIDKADNIDDTARERAQLIIDTGADDNSTMEVALTGTQLLVRRLYATGSNTRELVGLGGWALPRPLDDASNTQVQYSNNSLYVFSAYGGNDTSLARIPFNPSSTIPSQAPIGTTPIDISSTANRCNWSKAYFTAVSGNKFYLLCQGSDPVNMISTRNLFVYDNMPDDQNPKLGAAVPVTGIDSACTINFFQPLGNRTFALVGCKGSDDDTINHDLLSLSGSNIGATKRLTNSKISIPHDTLYNNILPDQEEIRMARTTGISSTEGVVGLVFGVLGVVFAIGFLTLRYRRRRRLNKARLNGTDSNSESFGLEPLGVSSNTHLSPAVYVAPQRSIPPSPALSTGLPASSRPTSPPAAEDAAPLSSSTLSPAPSEGSPPADTFQRELQQLGFSSHPRPNIVTTVND